MFSPCELIFSDVTTNRAQCARQNELYHKLRKPVKKLTVHYIFRIMCAYSEFFKVHVKRFH